MRALALGLLLLLAAAGTCSVRAQGPTQGNPISPEDLQGLLRDNPVEAKAAYRECMKFGSACQVPCKPIGNCAGCQPSSNGKATVCAYCMPGHILSANQQSYVPCAGSKGGKAAICDTDSTRVGGGTPGELP